MYDATKNATIFKERSVIDPTHPAVIVTMELADSTPLQKGSILAKSETGIVAMKRASEQIGTGDGSSKDFTATLQTTPIAPGSVSISDGTSTITDDGFGRLRGDGSGEIDYENGKLSVTFDSAPSNGTSIACDYRNAPVGVLVSDTKDGDTSAPVIVHGTVAASMLLVDETEADTKDIQTLAKNTQIIPI